MFEEPLPRLFSYSKIRTNVQIIRKWWNILNWVYWILGGINLLMWGTISVLFACKVKSIGALRHTEEHNEQEPKISVVIAARNEEKALERCIISLMHQTYSNLEVIVVNDRSDDSTGKIIENLTRIDSRVRGIEITELPPQWMGKSHALYQGTKQAEGDWILFT
ncbi:glycosyltransferase family 2 protein, partial [Streptomyces sp. NPDC056154]|uniref:glycosyltransferase family 2 protein n=1 Tax=Streptomyces sp. NPDC056154 TaxID=3345729 RepID=UPI0035E11843